MTDLSTVSLDELAALLHVSKNTMYKWVSTKPERLPPRIHYGGRKVIFTRAAVEKWLEERSSC